MPDIAVASTAAVVAAVPAAPSGNTADAGQSQAAGPFAQVLQQQIDNPAASDITTSQACQPSSPPQPTSRHADRHREPPADAWSAARSSPEPTICGQTGSQGRRDRRSTRTATRPITDAVPIVAAFTAPVTSVPVAMTGDSVIDTDRAAQRTRLQRFAAANLAANAGTCRPCDRSERHKLPIRRRACYRSIRKKFARRHWQRRLQHPHIPGRSRTPFPVPPTRPPINAPVGTHGWDAEVGNQLVWMAGNQSSRAELVLTPPQWAGSRYR